MRKLISILTAVVLCLVFMLPGMVSAASATANLSGPGTVRAGDTITLTFNLGGNGIYGASGTLAYDSNQLTLTGTAQKIASPWVVEFNGNNFVAYDNNLSNPINGEKALFTATFKVKSVDEGTDIKVSYTGVTASDGSADANIGTISYSKTVSAPLSTNTALASLTVSNATISPEFSPETTKYSATVPFDVAKLNVSATAADAKAKVSINSPNLTPNGTTNVTITVTAESGAKKTYTIAVKREQDPNYVANSNSTLSGLNVDGFLLSPQFAPDTQKYVVWLPYETTSVKVSGSAADPKASGVEVVGGDNLLAGQDNEVKIICTAEDGSKTEYVIIAKRAAAHDGTVDEKPADDITDPDEPSSVPDENVSSDDTPNSHEKGIAWWWLVVVGAAALLIGAVAGFLCRGLKK